MDMNSLISDQRDAIATNAAIKSWAQATYGKDHMVFVNIDVDNPPPASYCPYVVIYPDSKQVGKTRSKKEHGFSVVCTISDDSLVEGGESNVVEYAGVQNLEDFRKLVETAIAAVDIGNANYDEFDIAYDTITMFPIMDCFMAVAVSGIVTIGSDPLE